MRLRFGEMRSNPYTCCFCCHVRLGTVILGIMNLVIDLLAVAISMMFVFQPVLYQQLISDVSYPLFREESLQNTSVGNTTTMWMGSYSDDRFVSLILTVGSALLTVGLLYGTIKGYPRYLLPFFCLQVFDFCVASLSVIGYFSYAPNIKMWIAKQNWFPLKAQLIDLDSTWLLLLAAVIAVLLLWLKAYCISVVWNCYKFLCQGQISTFNSLQHRYDIEMVHFEGGEPMDFAPSVDPNCSVNVMVSPPKYEEIEAVSLEPPPYSAATAAAAADITDDDDDRVKVLN